MQSAHGNERIQLSAKTQLRNSQDAQSSFHWALNNVLEADVETRLSDANSMLVLWRDEIGVCGA